jgi:hypothetical protein
MIRVRIDDKEICRVRDTTCRQGVVALGTGWNEAYFDNFAVQGGG